MRLKGELDTETVEAMVREALARRFTGMVVTDISVGYIHGRFELDDSPNPNEIAPIEANEAES